MPKVTRPASALRRLLIAAPIAMGALMASPSVASAQDARTAKQLLEDFNHYVIIDQYDLAEASAQALLGMGLTPQQFLNLIEDSATLEDRFDDARLRALLVPQLEDDAAALYALYDQGRKARARNQDEIERNVDLLAGTAGQRDAARSRILEAREYAVPQLLDALLNDDRIAVRAEAGQLLIDLGRSAAVPLSVALPHLEPQEQEEIARILGSIRHRDSIPALYELWANSSVSATRNAARQAITNLDGAFNQNTALSDVFRAHAERYYNDRESGQLLAFPGEDHQLLWSWRDGIGLYPDAIRSPLYHEAVAMRSASHALGYDNEDADATALWLAANISRQLDQAPDYDNPAYPSDRPDADFFASALGHETAQRVLERALADNDVPIARRVIEALRSTAGSDSLADGVDGSRPLLAALSYPDRRVRYDAALALAEADPRRTFPGAERVVPTLAGMITQAGKRYALIIATEPTSQQDLRDALSGAGYDVLPPIASLAEIEIALADAPGVDLVIADLPGDSLLDARRFVRNSDVLGAAPMIGLAVGSSIEGLRAQNDPLTLALRRGVSDTEIVNAARQLVIDTVGAPLDDQDALIYAGFALSAMRDLAVSRNAVLQPEDATQTLLNALSETDGFVRRQVAEVLSYIDRSPAQRALADAAANAFDASEQGAMLDALAGSARRFGNLLEPRQEAEIIELATTGDAGVRLRAAKAAGALGLPGDLIAPILRSDG
ncbi:MAG: hypothetical protein Tsb0013_02660 [Phycisphaerales bacterium]